MAGHGSSKNGVASLACGPAIHVLETVSEIAEYPPGRSPDAAQRETVRC